MGASLRRLWAEVRRDFDQAVALLPTPISEDEGSTQRLSEWLDHNELGLALEELEQLGLDNSVQGQFWKILADAAQRMDLAEDHLRLMGRWSNSIADSE